ncbi:MAG: DUF6265 family protein [Acidobacteria bacterium]|nr:DUF6265 family protein [Acidobacteriota bacterium]
MAEMLLLLKFLTGCWQAEGRGTTVLEVWSRPLGGMMLGHSQTERAGKTAGYEYLRIEPRDGVLAYIPTIKGRDTVFTATKVTAEDIPTIKGRDTVFTATKVTAEEAVFENLAHDFPQRIIYRATPDGLSARVESADSKKGMNYPYKRTACHE